MRRELAGQPKALPENLKKQLVDYVTKEPAGTIIVDTPNTYLYLVLGNGKAMRYGIGVGREGFTWSGVQSISRKTDWPDWIPPQEMLATARWLVPDMPWAAAIPTIASARLTQTSAAPRSTPAGGDMVAPSTVRATPSTVTRTTWPANRPAR